MSRALEKVKVHMKCIYFGALQFEVHTRTSTLMGDPRALFKGFVSGFLIALVPSH